MTIHDFERRLTDLLQERAEGAMEQTKPQEQLSSLLAEGQRDVQRRRRWIVGGAAAVAAAAVAIAVGVTQQDDEQAPPSPIDPVGTPDPLSAAIATVFIDHTYDYQLDGVVSMMSGDVAIDDAASVDAWVADFAWREAAGFSLADLSCREGSTTAEGTAVRCSFTYHALGSEQLGRIPFGENTFDVVVRDSQIVRIDETLTFIENGFSDQMWEPFADWVKDRHPADVEVMYTDPSQSGARLGPASRRLWEQRLAEWVAFQQQ